MYMYMYVLQYNGTYVHYRTQIHSSIIRVSHKYRIAGKFGGLAVYLATAKLKSANTLYSIIYTNGIPYRTAELKSANVFTMAI